MGPLALFMTLYFQILTQTKDSSALNLLRFPTLLRAAGEHQGSATLASGGFVQKFKFANVEDLLSKMGSRPFNELELEFTIGTADLGSCRFNRVTVTGIFKPSACSELWLSHSKWERGLTREWLS